ncbi:MAG: response regulator [Proteobacteria bacterium]|nr:response regulator [Pseudomonadota bacterium]
MITQKTILLVDDEPVNLQFLRSALESDYDLKFARNGEIALKAANDFKIDLILMDIKMPGKDGYEVCKELKNIPCTEDIPVIFLTSLTDEVNEAKGFDLGAVDYIHKQTSPRVIRKRIETHLSLVRARDLARSQKAAIYMLGSAGNFNDSDTGAHIWRMAEYSKILAESAHWPEDQVEAISLAAAMHDLGKLGVPENILAAPRQLTPVERNIIETHTLIGSSILKKGNTGLFDFAAVIARSHHERWDGCGYPDGLKGDEIPEGARIVAIADVFDALTMVRPYKKSWSVERATAYIKENAGTHFDARLVDCFIDAMPQILKAKEKWAIKENEGLIDNQLEKRIHTIVEEYPRLGDQL